MCWWKQFAALRAIWGRGNSSGHWELQGDSAGTQHIHENRGVLVNLPKKSVCNPISHFFFTFLICLFFVLFFFLLICSGFFSFSLFARFLGLFFFPPYLLFFFPYILLFLLSLLLFPGFPSLQADGLATPPPPPPKNKPYESSTPRNSVEVRKWELTAFWRAALGQEAPVEFSKLFLGWCCLKPVSSFHCFTPWKHKRRKKWDFLLQEKTSECSASIIFFFSEVGVVLSVVRKKVYGGGKRFRKHTSSTSFKNMISLK